MFNLMKVLTVSLSLVAVATFTMPAAHAEYSMEDQPSVGVLHEKEAQLQAQLNRDYELGLIDPYELSNMSRDLDAIRCREEAFRMSTRGMTQRSFDRIATELAKFESNLLHHCDKGVPAVSSIR
jgi:hypothetical protein